MKESLGWQAGRAPEKEVDYFAILSTVLNYSLRMLGFLDNLEDLTVLGSAVSALAENVSDRRGIIRGWFRMPTHILLKGFALKPRHDG